MLVIGTGARLCCPALPCPQKWHSNSGQVQVSCCGEQGGVLANPALPCPAHRGSTGTAVEQAQDSQ